MAAVLSGFCFSSPCCGGGGCGNNNNGCNSDCWLVLILLFCCGGWNNNGCGCGNSNNCDAAADLFSVLPDVRAEKAPARINRPGAFFTRILSFSETVSVSVLLFPAFPSLLFFSFFSYIPDLFHKRHSLRVPVFFFAVFLFHPFSGGLLFSFFLLSYVFFPPSVIFFRPGT